MCDAFEKYIGPPELIDSIFSKPGSNRGIAHSKYAGTLVRIFHDGASELEDVRELREVLSILVEDYERRHYPVDEIDSVEVIKYRMEEMGLKQTDLAEYLGGRSRVSDILNRKRKLTVDMIRILHKKLNLPAETLI